MLELHGSCARKATRKHLLEEVTDTGCSNTHKHLHELRSRDGEEWDAGLSSNGLGQQGLSCAWWANQEHTLGDLGSHCREPLWPLQKLHHLDKNAQSFIKNFSAAT